ncbi:MAG: copper chaperone PCu(A)C [Pseudomonadota bacterium]
MKIVPLFAAFLLSLGACTPDAPAGPSLTDAWVRAAPSERAMTAAYLAVNNPTDKPLTITGVRAPGSADAMLHTTIESDGVSRMRPLPALVVPAGETTRFEPGGIHIMLVRATVEFEEGAAIQIEIDTDAHGTLQVLAPVRVQAPAVE